MLKFACLRKRFFVLLVDGGSRLPRHAASRNADTSDAADGAAAAALTTASSSSFAFEKILSLTESEILNDVLEAERSAIEVSKKSADAVETMFLDQALDAIKMRKERLLKGDWAKEEKENDFIQVFQIHCYDLH